MYSDIRVQKLFSCKAIFDVVPTSVSVILYDYFVSICCISLLHVSESIMIFV
jgi:hypothetical protein